jgi:hydrogenase maturation protease
VTDPVPAPVRLAIAVGSRLHHDDAVACEAANLLRPLGVQVLEAMDLTPDLARDIAQSEWTIVVDACRAEGVDLRRVEAAVGQGEIWTHTLAPESLFELARTLYGWPGGAWLCLIGVEDLSPGEGLTATARRNTGRAVQMIREQFRL